MISVNSDRLRNPANQTKAKVNKKQSKAEKVENAGKSRLIWAILLGLFILWGGKQIGAFQVMLNSFDNLWNHTTKMMGIRLEKLVLVDYELVGDNGDVISKDISELPQKEILEALGLSDYKRGSRSLMEFNPKELKAQLEELPWVQYVVIKRFLPDTIQIHIVPRTAFVMQKKGDEFVMLDSFGNELPLYDEELANQLLRVTGENSFKASLALINILAEEPNLLNRIELAERVSSRRWNIYLDNGVTIKMPEEGELAAWKKLAHLDTQNHIFDYAIDVVDFRLDGQLILRGGFKAEMPKEQKAQALTREKGV